MKLKLLIVEDNAEVRRMIRRVVSSIAGEINEVDDGKKAFAAYAGFLPDWVLMDIEMKQLSGITAAAEIKVAFPEANIVMVTNYNNANLREKAAQAGACGYVLKENLTDLLELLTT